MIPDGHSEDDHVVAHVRTHDVAKVIEAGFERIEATIDAIEALPHLAEAADCVDLERVDPFRRVIDSIREVIDAGREVIGPSVRSIEARVHL